MYTSIFSHENKVNKDDINFTSCVENVHVQLLLVRKCKFYVLKKNLYQTFLKCLKMLFRLWFMSLTQKHWTDATVASTAILTVVGISMKWCVNLTRTYLMVDRLKKRFDNTYAQLVTYLALFYYFWQKPIIVCME